MQFKKYFKQRNGSIQGLRSLKDTLPTNIKKAITLAEWIRFPCTAHMLNLAVRKGLEKNS